MSGASANGRAGTPPALVREGMGWTWEPGHGVRLRLDRLANRSDETTAEIEIQVDGTHVHLARLNLSSTTSRAGLVRLLSARTNGAGLPWDELIEGFCVGVLRREREGEATQYTHDAPIPPVAYLVDQLVQEGKPNLLFGPGAAGKGYLAVAMSLGVTIGRGVGPLTVKQATPFYLDWEDDFPTFNARVKRLCSGLDVPVPRIAYRRMKGILADRVNEVARAIAAAGATFGILDSVSACSGSPRTGETWDAIAHRLFDALDLIPSGVPGVPMTWLLIGHVTGDAASKREPAGKMFGSIQSMNRARCAWEVVSSQAPGGAAVAINLHHAKWNHTGVRPPVQLDMVFDGDAVRIDEAAPAMRPPRVGAAGVSDGEPAQRPPRTPTVADRLTDALAVRSSQSIRALSLATRQPDDTVRVTLNRYRGKRFEQDAAGLWGLTDEPAPPTPPDQEDDLPWA